MGRNKAETNSITTGSSQRVDERQLDVRHGCCDCQGYKNEKGKGICQGCTRWSNWVDAALGKNKKPAQ